LTQTLYKSIYAYTRKLLQYTTTYTNITIHYTIHYTRKLLQYTTTYYKFTIRFHFSSQWSKLSIMSEYLLCTCVQLGLDLWTSEIE